MLSLILSALGDSKLFVDLIEENKKIIHYCDVTFLYII